MFKWVVTYEVRELGAIGVFWLLTSIVETDNPTDKEAAKAAFRQKHKDRFEFRFCYKTERLLEGISP